MIGLAYNQESSYICIERSGDIFRRDLIDLIQRIDQDFKEQKRLRVLDDTGQSVSKFDHRTDYIQIINEIEKIVVNYERIYHAIVAETPANAALSSIYEIFANKIPNYTFRFFSSTDAAINWLKISA
jgi:hypothetical protein